MTEADIDLDMEAQQLVEHFESMARQAGQVSLTVVDSYTLRRTATVLRLLALREGD